MTSTRRFPERGHINRKKCHARHRCTLTPRRCNDCSSATLGLAQGWSCNALEKWSLPQYCDAALSVTPPNRQAATSMHRLLAESDAKATPALDDQKHGLEMLSGLEDLRELGTCCNRCNLVRISNYHGKEAPPRCEPATSTPSTRVRIWRLSSSATSRSPK